jgi:hypothetical protein
MRGAHPNAGSKPEPAYETKSAGHDRSQHKAADRGIREYLKDGPGECVEIGDCHRFCLFACAIRRWMRPSSSGPST